MINLRREKLCKYRTNLRVNCPLQWPARDEMYRQFLDYRVVELTAESLASLEGDLKAPRTRTLKKEDHEYFRL